MSAIREKDATRSGLLSIAVGGALLAIAVFGLTRHSGHVRAPRVRGPAPALQPAEPAPSANATPAFPSDEAREQARSLGLTHFEQQRDDLVLEQLVRVYRAKPDDEVALAIAEASLRKRDHNTAEVVLGALRSKDAPEALRVRGILLEQASKPAEALALYERALPQLTRPHDTLERRARVLVWLERFDEAATAYRALSTDPTASVEQQRRCRVRLAELSAWKKDLEGALAQLARLLAEEPKQADALLLQGQILEWQGRYPEAKRSYSNVLAFDASHAEARLRLDKLVWVP